MSVYTTVEADELRAFLTGFDLGELVEHRGISDGIENTNYFLDTTGGHFVMTLFEATNFEGLPFFLDLMAFLAERGLPAAHPMPDSEGRFLHELKGRPAAIVQRLEGKSVEAPSIAQCAAIGEAMAKMHVIGEAFPEQRPDDRGMAWRREAADRVMPHLPKDVAEEIAAELDVSARLSLARGLPSGVIHADLFRDNALFVDDRLTGVIDFYYAFSGPFVYDLAVLINDWCSNDETTFDEPRARAVADAYQALRPLNNAERAAWPHMLRHAGSRFWLSRLVDEIFPRPGEITQTKDPEVYARIVRDRRDHGEGIARLWG